jgi:ATP-dependent Lon protease
MYKGYMEQGSFSRGDEKGTVSADAGIVFYGDPIKAAYKAIAV